MLAADTTHRREAIIIVVEARLDAFFGVQALGAYLYNPLLMFNGLLHGLKSRACAPTSSRGDL